MLEASISQVVFITLESTLFLTQLLFLFTKLKSKIIKTFLVVNATVIVFNGTTFLLSNSANEGHWLLDSLQFVSILFMIGAVWFYLHGIQKIRSKNRFVPWLIVAASIILIPICFLISAERTTITSKVSFGGVLVFLLLLATYSFISLRSAKKAFWSFLTIFLGLYAVSFVIYVSHSLSAMIILLNILFLVLGLVHHLMIFNRLSIIIGASNSTLNNRLKSELSKYNLSSRQEEIAILVIKGYSSKEIAEKCHITAGAERKHVSNINRIVGVQRRKHLKKKFSKLL